MMKLVSVDYGKSMYDGWYADYFFCGEWKCLHATTRKELTQKLNSAIGYGAWEYRQRLDN